MQPLSSLNGASRARVVVAALLLLSTICIAFLGEGALAGRAIVTTSSEHPLVFAAEEEFPSFAAGAETAAARRRLSQSAEEGGTTREYRAFGQECAGDGTMELRTVDCPDEGSCRAACGAACGADELCEAFETKANSRCVLFRRCEVAETNNLPRTADGSLAKDYVRLRAWNITVRRSAANVCVRGCPASSPDYVVTRDHLRSCRQDSVVSTRDLSEACGPGDHACAFSACADFCRPEASCAEFAVTTDLLTCELQDGTCIPSIDLFANKFQGAFRG